MPDGSRGKAEWVELYQVVDGKIRFGLNAVKNVGEATCQGDSGGPAIDEKRCAGLASTVAKSR